MRLIKPFVYMTLRPKKKKRMGTERHVNSVHHVAYSHPYKELFDPHVTSTIPHVHHVQVFLYALYA